MTCEGGWLECRCLHVIEVGEPRVGGRKSEVGSRKLQEPLTHVHVECGVQPPRARVLGGKEEHTPAVYMLHVGLL